MKKLSNAVLPRGSRDDCGALGELRYELGEWLEKHFPQAEVPEGSTSQQMAAEVRRLIAVSGKALPSEFEEVLRCFEEVSESTTVHS